MSSEFLAALFSRRHLTCSLEFCFALFIAERKIDFSGSTCQVIGLSIACIHVSCIVYGFHARSFSLSFATSYFYRAFRIHFGTLLRGHRSSQPPTIGRLLTSLQFFFSLISVVRAVFKGPYFFTTREFFRRKRGKTPLFFSRMNRENEAPPTKR